MKEAQELIAEWDQNMGVADLDIPAIEEKIQALRLALQCEPENCIILRLNGEEKLYTIDEPNPNRTDVLDSIILDAIYQINTYTK